MADHPLLTLYVYGVYGWLAVLLFTATVVRHRFRIFLDDESRRLGVKPGVILTFLTIMYTVAWPITALIMLAWVIRDRGGRD